MEYYSALKKKKINYRKIERLSTYNIKQGNAKSKIKRSPCSPLNADPSLQYICMYINKCVHRYRVTNRKENKKGYN